MSIFFMCAGYGFSLCINRFDPIQSCWIIFSWHIMKNDLIWRGETHSRGTGDGYFYRCYKNGEIVEDISFRSPIVSNAR